MIISRWFFIQGEKFQKQRYREN